MEIGLLIETSAHPFTVILGDGNCVMYNSAIFPEFYECRELFEIVKNGLETCNILAADLKSVYVNIGPGGLNSVRSGVAFANALAYSLKIPVKYFNTFELTGLNLWQKYSLPVLCSTKANNDRAYFGLVDKGALISMKFGDTFTTAGEIIKNYEQIVVAGFHRSYLPEKFPNYKFIDSGMNTGDPADFYTTNSIKNRPGVFYPNIQIPLNEQSSVFNSASNKNGD